MSALRLVAITATPLTLGHRGALLALEAAHASAEQAHLALMTHPIGAPGFLELSEAWRLAEERVARCELRERTERMKAAGKRRLGVVR